MLALGSDGSTYRAGAWSDRTSSASFVTERLEQSPRLLQQHNSVRICGIGGRASQLTSHGTMKFNVTSIDQGKTLALEAFFTLDYF